MKLNLDYCYKSERSQYLIVPWELLESKDFSYLSLESKILYCLLKDKQKSESTTDNYNRLYTKLDSVKFEKLLGVNSDRIQGLMMELENIGLVNTSSEKVYIKSLKKAEKDIPEVLVASEIPTIETTEPITQNNNRHKYTRSEALGRHLSDMTNSYKFLELSKHFQTLEEREITDILQSFKMELQENKDTEMDIGGQRFFCKDILNKIECLNQEDETSFFKICKGLKPPDGKDIKNFWIEKFMNFLYI